MIVENIKGLCQLNGTNINRIEMQCGFSHGSVRKWDDNPPSVWKVKAVADLFGVTVDDIIREQTTDRAE